MFLALDIGNTNITVGLFNIQNGKALYGPLKVWRMSTVKERTSDEYAVMLMDMFSYSDFDVKKITCIAIASVVPHLNFVFEDLVRNYFRKEVFFINHINSGDIVFNVPNPMEIGADRIANAIAACSMYEGGCVVIDFGTATTFDCIDEEGRYIGGAIAPGPAMSAQSLNLGTAQLPLVEMKKPLKSIGNTTEKCIQSGLYFSCIGIVKEFLGRVKTEMKLKHIIATGGFAYLIIDEVKQIEAVLPNLTLEGIRIIWGINANSNIK